ncbi:unnamed protein product [Caenorhabditis angaria]|uniref:Uncharacterized protein n=1 Tax=Caenorhabditis angaria TaxID=860376 RepID=A0A9P1MYR4_9PELO|nr:unnamed protein product [Caenorhabditis angaria]
MGYCTSSKRPRKRLSVKMRQNLTIEQIRPWCKAVADRVFQEMPPLEFGDIDLKLTLDFSGFSDEILTKGLKKMMMDELMEELTAKT